ncbi:MAG TPA: two-component regulator propeller domain-containing protein, partial [bacterium]|nr:two-component regulator propeller domain-containing protein [bacterium]
PAFLCAQNNRIRLESLPLDDGLSYQSVYALYQDSRGYLWIGTISGLIRYDGRNNTVFRHEPENPHSLSHDDVVAIYEDEFKKIWIGTYGGGLNRYNPETGVFTRYLNDSTDTKSISDNVILSITGDKNGRLWIGTRTGGINVLNITLPDSGFTRFTRDPKKPRRTAPQAPQKLYTSSDGRIWIGAFGRGLVTYDQSENGFRYFPLTRNSGDTVRFYNAYDIVEINNLLWISTDVGLKTFDLKVDQWIESTFPTKATCDSLSAFRLAVDRINNVLWVGSSGKGLFKFDFNSNTISQNKNHWSYAPYALKTDMVTALLVDQSSMLWVATANGALQKNAPDFYKFDRLTDLFDHISGEMYVNAILPDSSSVWIGHHGGLVRINKKSIETWEDIFPASHQSIRSVTALWKDSDGALWVGTTTAGLIRIKNRIKTTFLISPKENTSYSFPISSIIRDKKGQLWVGTIDGGLNLFDEIDKSFIRYDPANSIMKSASVSCLYESSDSTMWVGTYGGLLQISQEGPWKYFTHDLKNPMSISHNYVYSVFCDQNGRTWVGTNNGLCYKEKNSDDFKVLNQKNGLPSDVIVGILGSSGGKIWVSTHNGISSFDPNQPTSFRNYDKYDGLPGNMFNIGAAIQSRDGTLWFGSIQGAVCFKSDQLRDNLFEPQVQIVQAKKFNQIISIDSDLIRLNYDENYLSISFSAMDFFAPNKNQYQYRLEPLEKAWHYAGNKGEAQYTDLAPGSYTLTVRATNRDGIWSSQIGAVQVIIRPPFWKTRSFLFLVAMTAFLLIWFVHRSMTKRAVDKSLEMERIRLTERERMREQISKDFHDELGHKLTKITLFSELSQRALHDNKTDSEKFLRKVADTSTSLSVTTRDFIWALDPGKDSLYDVIVNLRDFGFDLVQDTEIVFEVGGLTEQLDRIRLTMEWRRHLTLIFKEAMNNALKHAKAKHIRLRVIIEGIHFAIHLTDDGTGFSQESTRSTRNGLKNMQERAQKLYGLLSIESSESAGTHISFTGLLPTIDAEARNSQEKRDWITTIKGWFV